MRVHLPFLKTYRSKGRVYAYYRRQGHEVRIDGEIESSIWFNTYQRIHETFNHPKRIKPSKGTLAALILEYKRPPEYLEKAQKTRKDYLRYLDMLDRRFGDLPVSTIPRAFVLSLRDEFQNTPRKANFVLQVLRLLLSFAIDLGYRNDNPAARPKMLKTGDGRRPWSTGDIERFLASATPQTRLAVQLALFTGQRQSDFLKMTRSQYKDGAVEVVEEKTRTAVWILAHCELRATLDDGPRTNLVILTTKNGRPFKADYFRHIFLRQEI